ncbi:hypothetical protein, partial [Thioalkalivibrio denitrificans]|uniref:hypothetical protein n=1 Tax=Thioalkalivibrio denitrificans TaxID=108003 RepID=UPI001C378CDF
VDRQAFHGLTIDAPHPCGAPSGFFPATPPCSASHTGKVQDPFDLRLRCTGYWGLGFPVGGRPSGRTREGTVIWEITEINMALMPPEALLTFSPMAHRVAQASRV